MEKYLENIKFFNFDYEVFENAKELYKYQTQHHENFDIYILSIELEDMLGLEVARKLREDSQEALIIFVSNDAKCVFDVFEVFTFAFLLKPLTYNKFSTTLYNAFNYLYRTKRLFLFSYRKCNYSILCQSILYIEKLGRKAFIHTTDARVYQCNITLEKIWEQLNPSKFAAIHISYVILGINTEGKKEVLTISVGDNESAKYRLSVMNELKNRSEKNVLVICADGLTGIKKAIAAAFPKTEYQCCIVHQVKNTLKYVPDKDRKTFDTDLKTIYQASDEKSPGSLRPCNRKMGTEISEFHETLER